jgi:hypothetical protein
VGVAATLAIGTSVVVATALALSCRPRASGVTTAAPLSVPAPTDSLQPLRDFESARRRATDFAHFPASDTTLGGDPYALRRIPPSVPAGTSSTPHSPRFVGVLRGSSALVVLDDSLHETARLNAPASASSIAITKGGDVFVAGELSHTLQRFRFTGDALQARGALDLPDVRAIRGLAAGPEGVLYVVEEHDGRLLTLTLGKDDDLSAGKVDRAEAPIPFRRVDTPIGHGPLRVARVGPYVVVDCLLDHAIVIRRVDAAGVPREQEEVRIVHDGPLWGFDAVEIPSAGSAGTGLLVAAGGVEDHPLDRTEGSFGFIDSFVYLYRVQGGVATRLAAINTSAIGLITPKAVHLTRGARGSVEVAVFAYGSDRCARLEWAHDPSSLRTSDGALEPEVTPYACLPGSAAVEPFGDGSLAIANPLLDAWVRVTGAGGDRMEVVHVDDPKSTDRSAESHMGEALFFTSLMAPWDKSEGRLSRFTCETCHFEGYVDGRTHHTGRGDIHATTKPLLGLFNNKPHFSRALDPNLTSVADNEFRVAGAKSDRDPWFTLQPRDFPWTAELGAGDEAWTPDHLRRALMTFLMDFSHRPNPAVIGRTTWSSTERAGAEVFRDRCESCHSARLVTDDPSTRVPFERWESLVMAREGAIVWARGEYEKTGVLPYVNENGARVVSLRRLFKKYPYFTNGSAKSLPALLDRVRYDDTVFFHDRAPERATLSSLTDREKEALLAFLELL